MLKFFAAICLFVTSVVTSAAISETGFLPESFKASFVQVFKSTLTGKEKKSQGVLEYKYPGKIRFEITSPEKSIFVSNEEKSWYYTAPFMENEPGEVIVQPARKHVLSRFFDVLKKGLKSNELYTVKDHPQGKEVIFKPKTAKEMGVQRATLFLPEKSRANPSFKEIKEIELTYLDQKKVTLKLEKLETKLKFEKNYFVFEVPPKTRVVK